MMRGKLGYLSENILSIETCAEGFRINSKLLGKLIAIKKMGDPEHNQHNLENVKLRSTVERPKDFGLDTFKWILYVKSEAKRIKNENLLKEKREAEKVEKAMLKRRKIAEQEKSKFIEDFFKPISSWNFKKEMSR